MAKVDAMMMAAHQPSEVMVSAAMLDPSLANIDNAQVSLAGPDAIYISNILYAGVPYSALLKYSGGTSATVEAVYGPLGKLIPDSVGLSQTELAFVPPASLAVSNVEVGGVGYSGTLEYAAATSCGSPASAGSPCRRPLRKRPRRQRRRRSPKPRPTRTRRLRRPRPTRTPR